jgi:hypothetical protein
MTRRPWLLLLEFFAITLPLAWLWDIWGRDVYIDFFRAVTTPLLEPLGVRRIPEKLVRNRFLNVMSFVALMAITPGLAWRRRVLGTLAGLGALFVGHIALVTVGFHVITRLGGSADAYAALLPAVLISESLPFVLWAAIAHEFVRDLASRALVRVGFDTQPRARRPNAGPES